MIRVLLEAVVHTDDVEDLQRLLQAIRRWDQNRTTVHCTIAIDAPTVSAATVEAVLASLEPSLDTVTVLRTKEKE